MNDIGWQNPWQKKASEKFLQTDKEKLAADQVSFASKFLAGQSAHIPDTPQLSETGTYSQRYLEAGSASPQINKGPNELSGASEKFIRVKGNGRGTMAAPPRSEHPQGFAHTHATPWRFLDLKNKKQTGDLHKKLLSYVRKNDHKVFCFTSSHGGEGVTTVMANLADYIRTNAGGKTVLIVDANLKTPGLHRVFNRQRQARGILEVFSGKMEVRDALVPLGGNLWFMGAGNIGGYKDGTMGGENFSLMLSQCRQLADYVLVDCPPVLSSSDSLTIAPAADITFMILQAVKIHRQVGLKALSLLQDSECEIGGIILNRVQQVIPGWVYRFL